MVGHVNGRDLLSAVTHHHKGFFSGGKQLILRKGAAQAVDGLRLSSRELPAEYPHAAALVAGTDKAGVVNVALVGGEHERGNAVGVLVGERPFKACGQEQQRYHQREGRDPTGQKVSECVTFLIFFIVS